MHTPTPASIFKFQLCELLTIACSGETGECIARSENLISDPQYLLRYQCADGRAVEAWWSQEALHAATLEVAQDAAITIHTPPPIGALWPSQGGIYAGISRGVDGAPDHHLILCTLKSDDGLDWGTALDWAAALRIEWYNDWSLPTRAESALLYANLRDEFEPRWYWTSEQYSHSNAWHQYFGGGGQDDNVKSFTGRARAVRRLIIQSLSHS